MGRYKLMLVDDEQWALVGLEEILDWEAEGFTIVARCSCGKEALQKAKQFRPDAIITDIRMPDMTGLQLIEELRVSMPDIPCMVVSAYSDFDMAREAIRLDAVYYALKPFSKEEMGEAVSMMREKLRRNGKSEKEELVPLVIEEEAPVFPLFEGKGRKCYLLLAEELGSLPEQERQEDWWQLVQIGRRFGVLTDRIPEGLPEEIGVSVGFPDSAEAAKMIRTAEASLSGGFRFAESAECGKAQVSAADIQMYLYEHLSEDITLSLLAHEFFITETYLCDLFKKQTGETVVGFLRKLRLSHSKRLLVESPLSLGEIALRCGYKDYSYFGRQFKADVGVSPDLYRKRERYRV